ncbi:MAG TPA: hypothetical protein VMZ92_06050 [Planctomycetota bacterium]|nr:hypothetical protein [Planctomycetota bacterium]
MVKKTALVGLVLMSAGCWGTLATQAFHTVAGPMGRYEIISQSAEKAQMARYKTIEVAPFENTMPTLIKEGVAEAVQSEIVAIISRSGKVISVTPVETYQKTAAPAPTLVVTGALVDITKDTLPGERLVSNANHLIVRVKLLDKGSGRVLVDASLRGYVKSAVDLPQESLAKGVARAAERLLKEVCAWDEK